jgi:hypothetical protein
MKNNLFKPLALSLFIVTAHCFGGEQAYSDDAQEYELIRTVAHETIDKMTKENVAASAHVIDSLNACAHDATDLLALISRYTLENCATQLSDEEIEELKNALHDFIDPYVETVKQLHEPLHKLVAVLAKLGAKEFSIDPALEAQYIALLQMQCAKMAVSADAVRADINTYFPA